MIIYNKNHILLLSISSSLGVDPKQMAVKFYILPLPIMNAKNRL